MSNWFTGAQLQSQNKLSTPDETTLQSWDDLQSVCTKYGVVFLFIITCIIYNL